jgi:hypothetical protein
MSSEYLDILALEDRVGSRLAHIKRKKMAMKRAEVESGEAERWVTDHAIVRYLERQKGFDMDALKAEMRKIADESVPTNDGDTHWHENGVIMILGEEGQIVTVLSHSQVEKWLGRKLKNGQRIPMEEPLK